MTLKFNLNFLKNSKSHKQFFNFEELKNYQFNKIYKIVSNQNNIIPIFKINKITQKNLFLTQFFNFKVFTKIKNFKIKKLKLYNKIFLNTKKILLYNFNFLTSFQLKKLLIKKYKFNNKLKFLNILKYLKKYTLNIKKIKLKKKFYFFKSIYKNKWWFYFLKRIYPYISSKFYNFKFKNLRKKIFKFLIKFNFKKLGLINFLKLNLIKNLKIFLIKFNFKKLIIKISYFKILKIINFSLKLFKIFKILNLNIKNFKNWLKVKYNFNKKFFKLYYDIIQ